MWIQALNDEDSYQRFLRDVTVFSKGVVVGIIVGLVLMARLANGAELLFSADTPTTNADGTALTDLAGLTVRIGTLPTVTIPITVTGATATYQATVPEGTHCSVWNAYDTSGNVSQPSSVICKTAALSPSAPTPGGAMPLLPLVSFSTTTVGRTSYGEIKWQNAGTGTMSIVTVTFSSAVFSMTTATPVVIPAGRDGRVGLKFKPTVIGPVSGRGAAVLDTGETMPFVLKGTGR